MCEHLDVPPLPGKMVKGDNNSAIKEHHLFYNHSSSFDKFWILANSNNDFKVYLNEECLNQQQQPIFY